MHANRQCLVKAMSACSMDTERLAPPLDFTIPSTEWPGPKTLDLSLGIAFRYLEGQLELLGAAIPE